MPVRKKGIVTMMKKLLTALLALLLTLTLLCSCDGGAGNNSNASASGVSSTSGDASDTTSANDGLYHSNLPDSLDYNGETFTILSSYTHGTSDDMNTFFGGNGEYESNVVNDAAIRRNDIVEDELGVKIVEMVHSDTNAGGTGSLQEYVRRTVDSATVEYQMIQCSLYNCGVLTKAGMFEDMAGMKYIDFSSAWWNETFIEDTSFGSSVFYAVGDISFGHMNCIYFVLFNKDLQEQYSLDDFYQLVKDGNWTYDVMFQNSKSVCTDLDNDGYYTVGDAVGACGQSSVMWASYYASGGRITTNNETTGKPELTFGTEQSVTILTGLTEFFMEKKNYLILGDAESTTQLSTDKSLFFCYHTGGIKNLSEVESNIGFLPHPKDNEDQKDYYSLISPWGGQAVAVPFGFDDDTLSYISAVMEEMAVQGKNYLTDAFCETMCKYQKTRDEESIEMLDIIFNTSGCDLGLIYRFGGYSSTLQLFAENKNTAIASTIESAKSAAEIGIEEYIETIEALER